ncbi:RluA family pseudouridine synthase [Geomicrobium sp. JCM 19039]|uniref:RluA family pseudouridine synthase n=1 Tax=Geomicrobium sp. JCM 19039 TaxID=1460636 RepID=UPI0005AB47AB|nr:RluA family pseudouridine synthase [Geomicrobium sp. JCM 19039]
MHEIEWIIDEQEANYRLDKFVAEKMTVSRTLVQQWIVEGHVTVNGETSKSNYKVTKDDRVHVIPKEREPIRAVPEDIALDICYEDNDLLVINKPRGMVVHPAPGHTSGTVVNGLLGMKQQLSSVNDDTVRPGVVHRIDKDTSGLLIVAKNDTSHEALAKQLQERTLKRTYVAIVHGIISHQNGTIDAPLGRDVQDRQKMTVTDLHSKEAITHFSVMQRFAKYTLVECRLETGRTHQIRVHMEYIGHPLAGDPKYGVRNSLPIAGQALHARALTFIQPTTGEAMTVEAELPHDMQSLINNLEH